MNHVINSRKIKKDFSFFMPSNGGYIWLESPGKPGALGRQICAGGGFMGSTLSATPETFIIVCRRWYRAYMRGLNAG